jgi:N-acetylmuramoyl-L-alanine amidase
MKIRKRFKATLLGFLISLIAQAGEDHPNWQVDIQRPMNWLMVLSDGLVVAGEERPVFIAGPTLLGEIGFTGSFAQGLISTEEQAEVSALYPKISWKWKMKDQISEAMASMAPSQRLIVLIDPGHGGFVGDQQGAVGPTGLLEKKVTFEIGKRLMQELEKVPGIEVVMTRYGDENVPLTERVSLANQTRADLFISIHANGNRNRSFRGLETFFHSVEASGEEARRVAQEENAVGGQEVMTSSDPVVSILQDMKRTEVLRESSLMAHLMHDRMVSAVRIPDHGVMQADFFVLRGTKMPAVLLEVGFITNPVEEKTLRDPNFLGKVVKAIRDATIEFRKQLERKEVLGSTGENTQ